MRQIAGESKQLRSRAKAPTGRKTIAQGKVNRAFARSRRTA